jgi:hypothetical protein
VLPPSPVLKYYPGSKRICEDAALYPGVSFQHRQSPYNSTFSHIFKHQAEHPSPTKLHLIHNGDFQAQITFPVLLSLLSSPLAPMSFLSTYDCEESAEITGSAQTVCCMGSIYFIIQPLLSLSIQLSTGVPSCPLLQNLGSLSTQTKTDASNCCLLPTAH